MELTMRKYIGINIILFVLWTFILSWGIFLVISMGTSSQFFYRDVTILGIIIISLKLKLNYMINQSIISNFGTILICILNIYLFIIFGYFKILIFGLLFLPTFISLLCLKKIKKKALTNFIIYFLLISIFTLLDFISIKLEFSFEQKSLIQTLFIVSISIPIFYQKIIEYKYVRFLTQNIDFKTKLSNKTRYILYNIFSFIINLLIIYIILDISISKEKAIKILTLIILLTLLTIIKETTMSNYFKQNKKILTYKLIIYINMILCMISENGIIIITMYLLYIYLINNINLISLLENKGIKKLNILAEVIILAFLIFSLVFYNESQLLLCSGVLILLIIAGKLSEILIFLRINQEK